MTSFSLKKEDTKWFWDLAFSSNVTESLNDLILKMQGKGKPVSDMYAKVKSFQGKINVCEAGQ